MVRALRKAFPAALAVWLTRQDDGSWLDVILWQSREAAEEAARRINEVAEARSWFRHIAESHSLRHVEVVDGWMRATDESSSSLASDQET